MPAMRRLSCAVLGLALLALAGCGGPGVTIRRTGLSAPPRPAGCDLEVLRNPPERPYDALADLESHVTRVPPEGALSVVKPEACALGADAIVVVRELITNELGHTLVAVTAIKYRPGAPPQEPAPPPAPPKPPERPAEPMTPSEPNFGKPGG
jgi:hypothetical protein